jgi:hypothetical protein
VQKGLVAEGGSTPDSMVVFTSILDDFYGGDTNADSNATQPSPGNWLGIYFEGTSLPQDSRLDYTIIKHASGSTTQGGVVADNSSPTITNSIIANNRRGVQVFGSGNPVINFSDIYGNTEYGVFNRDGTFNIDATNNWWGDNSGPTHTTNPMGTGDLVSDNVNFGSFTGSGASNPVLGDVSLNGAVQSFDASAILRHVALLDTLNSIQLSVADVSGNGNITAMDASYVLQYVVGLIDAFPAELNSKARDTMNEFQGLDQIIFSLGEPIESGLDEITIPLEIESVSEMFAYEINLGFDEHTLEFTDVEFGEMNDGALTQYSEDEGDLNLVMASSEAIQGSGDIAYLTFRVKKEDASPRVTLNRVEVNEVDITATSVNNEELALNVPEEFNLYQNYPNPFNPSTNIAFDIPEANTKVSLVIYNILGQQVKTLVNDVYSAGRFSVRWDGTNDYGNLVSTGMYIYRIQAGNVVQSKKLTFIK